MGRPAKIVLLRHAEKPDDDTNPNLSPKGQLRAAGLAVLIPQLFGRPDAIFATAPSKSSDRPVETVTPLSEEVHVPIRDKWKDDEYGALAAHLLGGKYDGEDLVVCWHHEKLPELAAAIGIKPQPGKWPGAVFDRFWVITFGSGGDASYEEVPQHLLAGDA